MRFVPEACALEFGRPAGTAGVQVSDGRDKGWPVSPARGGEGACKNPDGLHASVMWWSMRCAQAGPKPGINSSNLKPETRSRGFSMNRRRANNILDVGGLQEFKAAEFYEGDVASGELDFEKPAVMRGPEQDRLLFQRRAALVVFQDCLRRHRRAGSAWSLTVTRWGCSDVPIRPKIFSEPFRGQINHGIGGRQNRLRGAIIPVERDDRRRGLNR